MANVIRLPTGSEVSRAWRRAVAEPYLLYTATLVPVVLIVAVAAQRPGETPFAIALSTVALIVQFQLGRWRTPLRRTHPRAWSLIRLGVPLLYVGLSVQFIGGPALPLLALFVPVVAGAAAIGPFQGWMTASFAAVVYLLPELGNLASPAAVVLRGLTLAGVALVVAFGTRRIVTALERAAREARDAAIAERRRTRQIAGLEEVGRLLVTGGPDPDRLTDVAAAIAERFGYDHVSIYLGDASEMKPVAQHGYGSLLPRFTPDLGVAGRVMRTGHLAFVPDVSADRDYVSQSLTATSLICAPLAVEGRLLGLLNVESSRGRRLDTTDRSVVGILATRLSTAIALGFERRALARRVEQFRDLEHFAREIGSSLSVEPLAERILDSTARILACDAMAVSLADPTSQDRRAQAWRGPITVADAGDPRATALAARAIASRGLVDEVTPTAHRVAVPLVRESAVLGTIEVERRGPDAAFAADELETLRLMALSAALAVANAFLHAEVGDLAIRDALTGLYNRRHFDEALDRMLAARRREQLTGPRPLSAIIFDLDHFGRFNKEHGHQVGDAVLVQFASVLRRRFRAADLVARLGGEEFIVVLDGANRSQAVTIADEALDAVAALRIPGEDGAELRVTVSAGCAELDQAHPTREALLRTADVALFMAKRAGRNRVVAA